MIRNKLMAIWDILTHRHGYIIPMHGDMTEDEVIKNAFNHICVHYLGRNIKGWNPRTNDALQARCDMMSTALHDKNVIMLSEHNGEYSIMRDCDTPDRVDELMSIRLPDKVEGDGNDGLLAPAKLAVGRACPYDTFGMTKVGSNACWRCPAFRAFLDGVKYVLCDNAVTEDMTLNGNKQFNKERIYRNE